MHIRYLIILLFSLNVSAEWKIKEESGDISICEEGNIYVGDKDAKIIVKVFSSLTCPYCADFHKKIFIKLKKEFIDTNLVRFEHHAFPLDMAALNAEKILR